MALQNPFLGESFKKAGAYFEPLRVSAQDIPNMTVKIASGGYMLNDNVVIEFVGGNSPTITAPGSNAKWVFVTLKTNGTIELLNGTASPAPAQPTVPVDGRLILAAIFVNAGTTAITNAMINDARPIFSSGSTLNHVSVLNRNHVDAHDIASITGLQSDLNTRATITQLDLKADIDGTISEIFTFNKDFSGTPAANIVLAVERGGFPNVDIRWNEGSDIWEFTNDGTTYGPVGIGAGVFYTVAESDGVAGTPGAKINKVVGATAGTIPTLLVTGELAPSAVLLTSVALTANHYTKAQNDGLAGAPGAKTDKVAAAVAGNFAGLNGLGNLTDSGFNGTSFALVAHTHTASQITDFNTAWTARHNLASIDGLADVVIAGPVLGEFLRWNGVSWVNIMIVKADVSDFDDLDYIHTTGVESKSGNMTFNNNVIVVGDLTVQGTTTTVNSNTVNIGDNILTLNSDVVAAPTEDAGIEIERGTAPFNARLHWNETLDVWQAGLVGSEATISLAGHTHVSTDVTDFTEAAQDALAAAFAAGTHVGVTVTYNDLANSLSIATTATEDHPDYNLFSALAAQTVFVTTFAWTAPSANKAAVSVFVNGIKQIEGATKDFTAAPGIITFNAGLIVNDDVEVYGYG